ncbi:MAG: helix-turn-helix domain-containing protein [Ruminococcaceae bacterium]|nr:helix-turn-helix domain-containing protein [Oscillospiraceae bacterium]
MSAKFERRILWNTKSNVINRYKNLKNLPHWHIEDEIIYVDSGEISLYLNNTEFKLKTGQTAFIKSTQFHSIKGNENSIVTVLKANSETVKTVISDRVLNCPVLSGNYPVGSIMQEILIEEKEQKEFNDIIINSLVSKLTAEIFRNEITHTDTLKSKKHAELLKFIQLNFDDVTFEKARDYMELSSAYFSKYFKKTMGMTFTSYLNTVRVTAAEEELKKGEKSITEIALSCGFGTIRNFNRVFKEIMGVSPREAAHKKASLKNEPYGFNPTLADTLLVE